MDLSGSSGIAISGLPAAHKRPCGRLLRKARRSCPPPTINRYSAYILAAKFYDYRTLPKQIASPSRLRALQRKRSHLTPSFREHGQRTVQQSGRTERARPPHRRGPFRHRAIAARGELPPCVVERRGLWTFPARRSLRRRCDEREGIG